MTDSVDQGRTEFESRQWRAAYEQLAAADRASPLGPEDLERLAIAASLLGLLPEAVACWTRAHQAFVARAESRRAARCAFWLAYGLMDQGESAQAAGWFGRGRRLLAGESESVEQGYFLFPEAFAAIAQGNLAAACEGFARMTRIGERFGDRDLIALGRHGEGRALVRMGETARGLGLLDESMVAVTAGEVSPLVAGDVYCGVLSACQEAFDLRRAREWTAALDSWCAAQPDLVAYRGQCLVRRAEVARWRGDWDDAIAQAERACAQFAAAPGQPGAGEASYQLGELFRLRRAWDESERAYREASRLGRRPQPGMALLRFAQGQIANAASTIYGALEESQAPRVRAALLPAAVEIGIAMGDLTRARACLAELAALANQMGSPFLTASAAMAEGALSLREKNNGYALAALRKAAESWRGLDVPYEGARTGVLLAIACRRLGDSDTCELELDAARQVLAALGAVDEIARLESVFRGDDVLTGREREVLASVATGKTNRSVARELGISEKTVARHLSNIFTKLDLSSRAAATAYAYEQGIAPASNDPSRSRG